MDRRNNQPRVFHILQDEALEIHHSAFGSVGDIYRGEGLEAVWVKKQGEEVDSDWFHQSMVDLILVVKGKLKVDFECADLSPYVLEPGDMIILPAETRCRAYRWPRDEEGATVFLTVYPLDPAQKNE